MPAIRCSIQGVGNFHALASNMRQPSSKFSDHQRNLQAIVVSALLVLGASLAYLIYNERELALARESERLLHQIRVIDANLTQQLVGMNYALISVRNDGLASSTPERLRKEGSARLRALTDAMPGVRTMLLTNAQGQVLASNRDDAVGFDVGQRSYFRTAQAGAKAQTLYVSEPFRTTFNVYSLNLVRTWNDAKGQFAGIITATLDPEYFQVLLRSVLYANDMRATLVHGDGKVVLTLPENALIEGADLAVPGTQFSSHMQSGRLESLSSAMVRRTGDERLITYRTVQPEALHMDKPLVLTVSRELGAVLAPWRHLAWVYGLTYCLISAVVLLSMQLLLRKQNALMDLTQLREQESREQAERLDLALGGAELGLWDLDVPTGVRRVNQRAQEIMGHGPDDPVDSFTSWSARVHPDDLDAARQARMAHEAGQSDALVIDYRARHKDGHWVWLHSRGKVTHRGPAGEPLRIIGTYLDITERKAAEAQIAEFAFYDPLTRLPNRRLLMDRLAQAQHASARSQQPGAVMFMDLDRFKWVNDTWGHEFGDLLLQQVAERLQACVRQSDTVARLGGDEFVLVIHQLGDTLDEATRLVRAMADKMLGALRQPVALGAELHTVTTSIGIALFCGEECSAAELIKQADKAMYQAKAEGRNGARIYLPGTVSLGADTLQNT